MPRRHAIGAALILVGIPVLAGYAMPDPATADGVAPKTMIEHVADAFAWRFDGQAYVYETGLARSPDSPLNQGNLSAKLPNFALTAELRPNARATSEHLDLVAHPRLTSVFETGGVAEREAVRGYFQEAYVRIKPVQDVSLTAGRELLTWGPAFFRSPSNPYYFNNARINPIIELSGLDVVRATYAAGSAWSLSGGVVLHSGHNLIANDEYRQSLLLKADYNGSDYSGSLILATRRGQSLFVGGYAQATLNDAVLAYGEFGASSQSYADNVLGETSSTATVLPAGFYASRRSATALIGASYTFANGNSLYGEYLYNGFGFNQGDEQRFLHQARQSGALLAIGGSLSSLAGANVGTAATRAQDLLGQHYIYIQYQNNPAAGNTLWRLMAGHNLTDHSTQLSAYFEQNVSDRVSLFALGIVNLGSPTSEFPALFRTSITAGAKIFMF